MWGKEVDKWLAEDTTLHYGAIIRLHILGTTAALWRRMFDLHRNDIYAILSEGKNIKN